RDYPSQSFSTTERGCSDRHDSNTAGNQPLGYLGPPGRISSLPCRDGTGGNDHPGQLRSGDALDEPLQIAVRAQVSQQLSRPGGGIPGSIAPNFGGLLDGGQTWNLLLPTFNARASNPSRQKLRKPRLPVTQLRATGRNFPTRTGRNCRRASEN